MAFSLYATTLGINTGFSEHTLLNIPTAGNDPMFGFNLFPCGVVSPDPSYYVISNGLWLPNTSTVSSNLKLLSIPFPIIVEGSKVSWDGYGFDTTSISKFFTSIKTYLNTNEAAIRAAIPIFADTRANSLDLLFWISKNKNPDLPMFDFWMVYLYEGNYGTAI